ncbi:TPA: hypothetical protein JD074_15035 [Clostridioides difficile]|nr:hypothetical protein C4E42_02145 [Clostridioides difficile]CCK87318.1 Conserved hypothetical protein [Clostridioides difficile T5]CCK94421.1 Conserved hypothetical protein [Clostridioides difficile E1]AVD38429.1 hypothetical protein C4E26_03290 [Clostridioides difficile]AVD41956.1 hypothetical protein C4E25_03295 [Clostridioides difficile]
MMKGYIAEEILLTDKFSGLMQNMHKAVTFKVVSYKVTWSMKFTRPKYTFGRFYLSKFSLRGRKHEYNCPKIWRKFSSRY